MKKLVSISIFIMFITGGLYAQRGLINHQRFTQHYNPGSSGPGSSLNEILGYKLLGGKILGVIDVKVSFGPSFINGDTNGPVVFPSFKSNNMISLQMNHIFPGNFGYELSYMYGTYAGNDTASIDRRNYAYKSTISEISIRAKYFIFGGPYADNPTHSVYVYGGFGLVFCNESNNKNIDLGFGAWSNGTPIYKPESTMPVFPFGIGYQYALTDNISVGAEISGHYILGDYAEGLNPKPVADGGHNEANDNITHFAITLAFKLYRER